MLTHIKQSNPYSELVFGIPFHILPSYAALIRLWIVKQCHGFHIDSFVGEITKLL